MVLPRSDVDLAVIGGGPAGLMAAERLATSGFKVTIYDQMPSLGRKFLLAGRGGLNLTHSESFPSFVERYKGAAPYLRPALEALTPEELCRWVHGLGQETFVGTSGRVFPMGLKASPLLRALLRRLDTLGVEVMKRHRWQGWRDDGSLLFQDASGEVKAKLHHATILALGGASWPRMGSDGQWTSYLRDRSIALAPLRPANCGFVVPWSSYLSERFEGQILKPVRASFEDQSLQGEIVITQKGVEGGPMYALSSALRHAIEKDGSATLTLDLRPGISLDELEKRLEAPKGAQSTSTYLRKAAALTPLCIALMHEVLGEEPVPNDPRRLANFIKALPLKLIQTSDIARAISSAGGIMFSELDDHFMLKKMPGVFAIGEMVDWEAPTGGYLLQASFSMAALAAKGVIGYAATL